MSARTRRGAMVPVVLAGLALVSLIVFAALLGPQRAAHIAAAAVLSTTVDGLVLEPQPHRIPILELTVDQARLDSLEADLPWSGGRNIPAILHHHGAEHKVRFRYRGVYATSHFLGGKRSFRLSMKRSNPFAPYRKVNVINPKAFNLVNDHMAAWLAGSMGVPVPWNEMVFVRLNNRDIGVMELFEQVDGDFEMNRHLVSHEVPVYKGDYPPVTGRELTKGRNLWQDAAHWEYASDADSSLAHQRLKALVDALRPDDRPLEARRDTLAQLVDVEAFLRYQAAVLMLNTKHIDQYHNQWLVLDPRTDRFYPVLWDALLLFAQPGDPLYYVHDALAYWMLQVPEWRLQRDRYVWQALQEVHLNGGFNAELDRVLERIRPSVLADRNKFGNVTLEPEDVHRFSLAHVVSSIAGLRTGTQQWWERTRKRLAANDVEVVRGDSLQLRSNAEAPLRLSWPINGEGPVIVRVDGREVEAEVRGAEASIVLHRTLVTPDGKPGHPYADRRWFNVAPLNSWVRFPQGPPPGLRITNAVTDEEVR
ncbi:MAG TPA: CotH kinase family protein [Flavobacteriales bacterium]|nr:CotH kinase family protein [Flavobacteriales bacterium]